MNTIVVEQNTDIVIVDLELAFAMRGTWAMLVRNVSRHTLKLVLFVIQRHSVRMIVQDLVSVIINQVHVNAMNIGKERIVLDQSARNITSFVQPVMRKGVLSVKMDSVLTKQQSGESNVSHVGDLIQDVVLVVKMRVRRVLICYCYPSIVLGDVHMIHPCRMMS